ncbi:DUF3084 domain-containing protein [bacterium]|nr:DUF3084 domain-containing protein [bacterium]
MYSWLLIGMLLAVSGIIAFVGDYLGRKIGKKRVSIIRLRPRNTAILFSIITGMLISLFTLLVLSRVSYPVRVALFGVENLLQERNNLQKEIVKLRKTQAKLSKEVEKRNKEITEMSQKLKEQTEELSSLLSQVKKLRKDKTILESYLKRAGSEAKRLTNELVSTRNQLLYINGEYKKALASLEESNAELERRKSELAYYMQRLQDTQTQIKQLTIELNRLEENRKNLAQLVDNLQKDKLSLESDLEQLKRQNESLRGELVRKEKEILSVASYYGEMLSREVIYPKGKEIIRGIVECGRSQERIKLSLRSLIKQASDEAIKKGAGIGEDGKAVSLMKLVETKDGVYMFPEETVLEGVAQKLSTMQGSVVVRLIALRNFAKGEHILADLEIYRNSVVFDKGEVVASTVLDGRSSEGELLEKILLFLRRDVRIKALQRGLVPGEDETVGEIPLKDIINTIASIKGIKGKVLLKAVANKRIWSANPLDITLQVSEVSS